MGGVREARAALAEGYDAQIAAARVEQAQAIAGRERQGNAAQDDERPQPSAAAPVAVPAAAKAAATTTMSTGACRFRILMTDSRESRATGAPEGSGTSQVGQVSRGTGHLQPDKRHKTAATRR